MTRSAGSVRRWPRSPPHWTRRSPVLPDRFPAGGGAVEPFVMLQGQALLAVLDQGQGSADPRDLPPDELAAALMDHERRRWRAMAASWDWGSGTAPSAEVQGRAVAALALLGAETKLPRQRRLCGGSRNCGMRRPSGWRQWSRGPLGCIRTGLVWHRGSARTWSGNGSWCRSWPLTRIWLAVCGRG